MDLKKVIEEAEELRYDVVELDHDHVVLRTDSMRMFMTTITVQWPKNGYQPDLKRYLKSLNRTDDY